MINTRLAFLTSEISSECIFSDRLPVSDCHSLELSRSVPDAQKILHAYFLGNAGGDGEERISRAHRVHHWLNEGRDAHAASADSALLPESHHHARRDST